MPWVERVWVAWRVWRRTTPLRSAPSRPLLSPHPRLARHQRIAHITAHNISGRLPPQLRCGRSSPTRLRRATAPPLRASSLGPARVWAKLPRSPSPLSAFAPLPPLLPLHTPHLHLHPGVRPPFLPPSLPDTYALGSWKALPPPSASAAARTPPSLVAPPSSARRIPARPIAPPV